jgi:hypothetical protein
MLLAKKFSNLQLEKKLYSAIMGLLFVNVSMRRTLAHFAASCFLMIVHKFHLTIRKAFMQLGELAIVGVIASIL